MGHHLFFFFVSFTTGEVGAEYISSIEMNNELLYTLVLSVFADILKNVHYYLMSPLIISSAEIRTES